MEYQDDTTELNEKVTSEILKLAECLKEKAAEGIGWEKLLQTAEVGVYEICMSLDLQNVKDFKDTLSMAVRDLHDRCIQNESRSSQPAGNGFLSSDWGPLAFDHSSVCVIDGLEGPRIRSFLAPMLSHFVITRKQPTAIFSYGCPVERLINEWLINGSRSARQDFFKGTLSRQQWERLDAYIGKIADAELFSSDESTFSMEMLRVRLRWLCHEHPLRIVVLWDLLEHLGFCPSQMDYGKLNSLMIDLKRLAENLSIQIVVLSHLRYDDMPVAVDVHLGFDDPSAIYPRIKRDYLH